ncbi:MAG: hypothetical protein QW699_06660 [Metallosphaera sp.]
MATDEAELKVEKGMKFRDAYFYVAKLVREGKFSPSITYEQSLLRKVVEGSPSPERMSQGISLAKKRLEEHVNMLIEYKNKVLEEEGKLRLIENDILQEGN